MLNNYIVTLLKDGEPIDSWEEMADCEEDIYLSVRDDYPLHIFGPLEIRIGRVERIFITDVGPADK